MPITTLDLNGPETQKTLDRVLETPDNAIEFRVDEEGAIQVEGDKTIGSRLTLGGWFRAKLSGKKKVEGGFGGKIKL